MTRRRDQARMANKPHPSDGNDEEWASVSPYLILFSPDAGVDRYELRDVLNALAMGRKRATRSLT